MKGLHFRRAGRIASARLIDGRIRRAVHGVELLESRRLFAATVLTQVPTQTVTDGQTAPSIDLSTYMGDPALTGGTVIEMQTPLGNIPLVLTDSQTPLTVANFKSYITNGEYTPTIFQRVAAGFVIQGGGTKPDGSTNMPVGSLQSEAGISNTEGTIAMRLSSGPDSGTNQWFINLADNATTLDGTSDGGPFTVFGNVVDGGMTVANAIAQLQLIDGGNENSNWAVPTGSDSLPVINYTGSQTPTTVPQANLVTDNIVVIPPAQAAPTYSASVANTSLVTATLTGSVLTPTPASPNASGTTTVTATVQDLAGETASSTFTVNVQGTPIVTVSDATGEVGTGNQVVFPVTLSTPSASPTTFDYSLTGDTAPDTDFQAAGTSFTIPAGTIQASIPVSILGDSTGGTETFTVTLSSLSSNAVFEDGAVTDTATGTIEPAGTSNGATTTTVTAASLSPAFGASDTFTANITPAISGVAVTGTVTFSVGTTVVGTAAVSANSASLAINLNITGDQTITAAYSGDSLNPASTSTPIIVVVGDASTLTPTLGKVVVPSSGVAGQPFKGSIALTLNNTDQIAPQSGGVTVKIYATTNGTVTPDSVVIASMSRSEKFITGKPVTLAVPIKALPGTVGAGSFTLVVQAVDTTGVLTTPLNGPVVMVAIPSIALAELFTKLSVPAAALAGAKTSAVAVLKITNNGNILSSGNTTIGLYASTDGTVADGTLIKSLVRKLAIKPGKSTTVTLPLGAYPPLASGNYFIVGQVINPLAQASSVVSTSSVKFAAAFIDLTPVAETLPATAVSGKSTNISLSVTNLGNSIAKGFLDILFALSQAADGSDAFSLATLSAKIKLQPNGTQILHLKLPVPAGTTLGDQFLVANVDPNNTFDETDLTNNFMIRAISVTG